MEQAKGPVNPLHSDISITLFAVTGDIDIVQSEMFELLQCPRCEHKPGNDGVDKKQESICDSSRHTTLEDAALIADSRAGCGATARSTEAHKLEITLTSVFPVTENIRTVPRLGTASSGKDKRAPMVIEIPQSQW